MPTPAHLQTFLLAFVSPHTPNNPLLRRHSIVGKGGARFESRRNEGEQHRDWWYKASTILRSPCSAPRGQINGTAVIVAAGGGHRQLVFNPRASSRRNTCQLGVTALPEIPPVSRAWLEVHDRNTAEDIRAPCARCAHVPRNGRSIRTNRRHGLVGGWRSRRTRGLSTRGRQPEAQDPVERANARPDFRSSFIRARWAFRQCATRRSAAVPLGAADDEYLITCCLTFAQVHDAGAPIETHIYAQGKHGFNMGQRSPYVSVQRWPQRLAEWLEDRGLTKAH